MKIEDENENIDENCILFHNVYYFGCSSVTQPHDKKQVQQAMSIMTSSSSSDVMTSEKQIEIVLSIPRLADGCIRYIFKFCLVFKQALVFKQVVSKL